MMTIKTRNTLINMENKRVVARAERAGIWSKWVKRIKRYKLPVIK